LLDFKKMKYDSQRRHRRRSIRLKDYDYSQAGAYFVTICAYNRACIFGDILEGQMKLNRYGEIVNLEWLKTINMRTNLVLDAYIIMPNHIRGIISIADFDHRRGRSQRAHTFERFGKPVSNSIPTVIRLFKSSVTKKMNALRGTPGLPVWQRNYYEHVIRNEGDLSEIREYILNNALKWDLDSENPKKFSGHLKLSING
jgi:putative transposase